MGKWIQSFVLGVEHVSARVVSVSKSLNALSEIEISRRAVGGFALSVADLQRLWNQADIHLKWAKAVPRHYH